MRRPRAHLEMVLALASLGANVAVSKWIAERVPSDLFALLRFLIAVPVLLVLTFTMDRAGIRDLGRSLRRFWGSFLVLGGVGTVLYTLFLMEGVQRTTAMDAGLISAAMPVFVLLWALVLSGTRPTRTGTLAVGLSVAGLVLLNFQPGTAVGAGLLTGNALVALAFVAEAFFVIRSKQLLAHIGPLQLGFWMHLAGLVLICAWLLVAQRAVAFPGGLWFWAVAVAYILSASVLAIILFNRAIPHLSAQVSAVYSVIVPVTAFFVAWLFLGEAPVFMDWIAFALLAFAMLLVAVSDSKTGAKTGTKTGAKTGTKTGA